MRLVTMAYLKAIYLQLWFLVFMLFVLGLQYNYVRALSVFYLDGRIVVARIGGP